VRVSGYSPAEPLISWPLAEWSGINALLYYGPLLVRSLGLNGKTVELLVAGGVPVIQFLAVLPVILYIDKWGMWPGLSSSCLVTILLLDRAQTSAPRRQCRDDNIAPVHCLAGTSTPCVVLRRVGTYIRESDLRIRQ